LQKEVRQASNGVAISGVFGIIIPIMLMIRLQRVGRKNDPSFRVVVTEKTKSPQSGGFLEIVGSYDPRKDRVQLKNERIQHWLSHGAKASGTVHNILVNAKIVNAPKMDVLPSIKKKEAETPAEAPKAEGATEEKAAPETPKEEPKPEEQPKATPQEETTQPTPEVTAGKEKEGE